MPLGSGGLPFLRLYAAAMSGEVGEGVTTAGTLNVLALFRGWPGNKSSINLSVFGASSRTDG